MGNIKTVTIYYGPYREKVNRFPVSMYDKQSMDADIDKIEKWFQKTVVDQNKIFETLVEDEKLTDTLAESLFGRDISFSMQTGEETKKELEELEEQDIDKEIKQIESEIKELEGKKTSQKDVEYYTRTLPKMLLNDEWAFYTLSSFFRAPTRYKEKDYIKEVFEIVFLDNLHKIPSKAEINVIDDLYNYFSKRYPKLTEKDEQNLKTANDIIEGRQSYGLREELAEGKAIKAFWSNGSAQWHMDRTYKPGDIVTLDANEIIFPLTEKEFERIRLYLAPLPLYQVSFEAKQRGHAPKNATDLWAMLQKERKEREKGT